MRLPDENEYCVRLIDLPDGVNGFVTDSEDGYHNIYLNARMTCERRRRALLHELRHIRRGDARRATDIRHAEGKP